MDYSYLTDEQLITLSENFNNVDAREELNRRQFTSNGLASFKSDLSDIPIQTASQTFDYKYGEPEATRQFDLKAVQEIISQMEEEKDNYIERPEDGFNMNGILQSLGGYAKDAAGRYIGSQALSGAGGMLFGPIGALVGGIFGALKGGGLFNQNTYSQQMYNNLTSQGQRYVDQLYGPGGVLQGYNQFNFAGTGALGTIAKNLAKYPNMSLARRNAHLDAANKIINSQDYSKTGIAAVTKNGHAYDDITKYIQPSNGDSGSSGGWSGGSGDNWGGGFDSDQATL